MPFRCKVKMSPDHLGAAITTAATIVRWLEPEGKMLKPGDHLVELEIGENRLIVAPVFPCLVMERATEGAMLSLGDVLVELGADGEAIPYGRAYCTTHVKDSGAAA